MKSGCPNCTSLFFWDGSHCRHCGYDLPAAIGPGRDGGSASTAAEPDDQAHSKRDLAASRRDGRQEVWRALRWLLGLMVALIVMGGMEMLGYVFYEKFSPMPFAQDDYPMFRARVHWLAIGPAILAAWLYFSAANGVTKRFLPPSGRYACLTTGLTAFAAWIGLYVGLAYVQANKEKARHVETIEMLKAMEADMRNHSQFGQLPRLRGVSEQRRHERTDLAVPER